MSEVSESQRKLNCSRTADRGEESERSRESRRGETVGKNHLSKNTWLLWGVRVRFIGGSERTSKKRNDLQTTIRAADIWGSKDWGEGGNLRSDLNAANGKEIDYRTNEAIKGLGREL